MMVYSGDKMSRQGEDRMPITQVQDTNITEHASPGYTGERASSNTSSNTSPNAQSGALVYLIGAGPGDSELLTLKGMRALTEADVVVYDYLSNDALLAHAHPQARRVYVGKEGFTHHITQEEINEILVREALADGGQVVARLKGGDPFVFGRGGEEALALAEHGIPFEVVPGITAGVGALAYAGIPVTHRGVASSMALVTGHEDPTKDQSSINWEHLAHGVDTICFYMGIKNLSTIVDQLTRHGKDPQTPVTLVRWGSTAQQEVLSSTLERVVSDVQAVQFKAPAIICVGQVGALRDQLAWFDRLEQRPLFGQTIVVTRSRTQASDLVARLARSGADVIELPTIAFERITWVEDEELKEIFSHIQRYDRIVFTSANGVDFFMESLHEQGFDSRALGRARIAVVGRATSKRLESYGIRADVVPQTYDGHALIEALAHDGVHEDERVLVVRPRVANTSLADALRGMGARVDEACVYQTVLPSLSNAAHVLDLLRQQKLDGITFTSSSTVINFIRLMVQALEQEHHNRQEQDGEACSGSGNSRSSEQVSDEPTASAQTLNDLSRLLSSVTCYTIGPMTTRTAVDCALDFGELVEAPQATIEELVRAVIAHNR